MADSHVVLDTSAVMTFLCDEEGSDTVEGYLNHAQKGRIGLCMSFATLAEVFSSATKKEGKDKAESYVAVIKSWPVKWVYSNEELCLSAGTLKAQYRISFADAFIAATAIHLDAVLVHKDPEFEALKAILRTELLPHSYSFCPSRRLPSGSRRTTQRSCTSLTPASRKLFPPPNPHGNS